MRYLILSDIHANLEALDAVMAQAPPRDYDRVLVLGDIVGYGADPNAVVDRIRTLAPDVIIRGNHDKVACGIEEPDGFNQSARHAALWTYDELTADNRSYLAGLPRGPLMVDDEIEVCHGSPEDEDAYIFEHVDALNALLMADRPLCFFGHTHVQIGYWLTNDQRFDVLVPDSSELSPTPLTFGLRYMINPGSVGQPRDGDPRAAFAEFDSETHMLTLRRVSYDVASAQAKITSAGLPEGLARRLGLGK